MTMASMQRLSPAQINSSTSRAGPKNLTGNVDSPIPLTTPGSDGLDGPDPLNAPLGGAEQACKECHRRKAKCDRGIPICSLCIKYGRHCLYEKHSKTPLTRKHLTEVEEKLERAEALLRQALLRERARAAHDLIPTPSEIYQSPSPPLGLDPRLSATGPESLFDFNKYVPSAVSYQHFDNLSTPWDQPAHRDLSSSRSPFQELYFTNNGNRSGLFQESYQAPTDDSNHPSNSLDGPPKLVDDFEWDERGAGYEEFSAFDSGVTPYTDDLDDTENRIIDGMASLTVNERESGYLGMTSGAALLRIIDPTGSQRAPRGGSKAAGLSADALAVAMDPSIASYPLYDQPNENRHILDSMIDAYFRLSHISYPLIHEATFRAQYSEVIERPNGDSWLILAHLVAAVGVFTTSTHADSLDIPLLAKAKSLLSITSLETGNLTLVQSLTLAATLLQKRNMPNSAYNYLGLAVRMAMGIGLHKEFKGWKISALKMEIRRRVWWTLCVFDVGATITFSRPLVWPDDGIEVALPVNVNDRDLTAASKSLPPECEEPTAYTSVHYQAAFNIATKSIYARVISHPYPSASTLLTLDATHIAPWEATLPPWFSVTTPAHPSVPPQFSLAHATLRWRCSNLRIIMYRPFVIREALRQRDESLANQTQEISPDARDAYHRCLEQAEETIYSIQEFWEENPHTRMAAWYALYFLFQASLIPVITIRNDPTSPHAPSFRRQILSTLSVISDMQTVNPSAERCHNVIMSLCGQYLSTATTTATTTTTPLNSEQIHYQEQHPRRFGDPNSNSRDNGGTPNDGSGEIPPPQPTTPPPGLAAQQQQQQQQQPIDESPQIQMNNVYSMMWPHVPALEADIIMQDDAWMEFLEGRDDFSRLGGAGGEGLGLGLA